MIQIYQLLSIVAFLIGVLVVEARFRCHNRCSGHGYCSDYDNICYCKKGYQGVDCSESKYYVLMWSERRLFLVILPSFLSSTGTCPMDFAWADKAYRVDAGHSLAECSNAGKCNRRTVMYLFFVLCKYSLTWIFLQFYLQGACECSSGYTGIACEKSE